MFAAFEYAMIPREDQPPQSYVIAISSAEQFSNYVKEAWNGKRLRIACPS